MQVLVDTSVWFDYSTGRSTPEADRLHALLGRSPLLVADVVLMEVLLALPDELHRRQAREVLTRLWLIEAAGFDLAEKTAVNYHPAGPGHRRQPRRVPPRHLLHRPGLRAAPYLGGV